MNILWTSNITFRNASIALGLQPVNNEGWLFSLAQSLQSFKDISLTIVCFYEGSIVKKVQVDGMNFIVLPKKKNVSNLVPYWKMIVETSNPDLVHINGTEYGSFISLIENYPNLKYVVSIQGLVGVYSRYFLSGFNLSDLIVLPVFSLRMILMQQRFKQKGINECVYFSKCKNVIGRTTWDRVHALSICPTVNYHFCNESLRSLFYTTNWNIDTIERNSIFLSQASYSIKGLHIALRAFEIVKQIVPNLKVYISGNNPTQKHKTLFKKFAHSFTYGTYIKRDIENKGLTDTIVFLGNLNEEQMVARYCLSHLFVCPSTIENSPNSVGEAQILGVPVIASYVGGIPDMIKHEESGLLYRLEEHEMLASHILDLFNDDQLVLKLSSGGKSSALSRHNRKVNAEQMVDIYRQCISLK